MSAQIGTQPIETENLILRAFEYKDCKSMHKNWASDESVQVSYGEPVYPTVEDVKGLLDKHIANYSNPNYYRWAVIDKNSGECIGQIAFFLVDTKNNYVEVEYCIGTAFQCRGYATEATKAVIDFGFKKAQFHKIQICHRAINIPSKKVISKCGFTYEGTLRDYFLIDGKYQDRLYYSILESEYVK